MPRSREDAAMLLATLHVHLHWFHHVKGPAFDYIGVAIASFASWAGLPGPGESLLLAAGIFAAKHKLDIAPLLAVAWAGATAGGIVGWLFGLIAGRSVLTAPGPLRKFRLDAVSKGEQAFKRHEAIAVLLTPSWVAGIYRAGTGTYNIVNATSAIVWALSIGIGAYYIGPVVLEVIDDFGTIGTVVAIAIVAIGVGTTLIRRWRGVIKRQDRRDAARVRNVQPGESTSDG
jgi:membrane protein DedA with SNARE-associated domain